MSTRNLPWPERAASQVIKRKDRLEVVLVGIFFIVEMIPSLHFKLAFSSDSALNQITWSVLYVFAGIRIIGMRERTRPLIVASLPLLGFCALMFLSTMWSVDATRTVNSSIELLGSTLIGYYLVLRFTTSQLLRILAVKFAIYAATSYALIVLSPGRGRDDWGSGPWSGVFPEKNALGAAMAVALVCILCLSPRTRGERFLQLVGGLAFAVLLIGSQSATAFASCVVTLATFTILRIWRSPKISNPIRFAAVAALPLLGIGALLANMTPATILTLLGRSPSLTGRTDFWPFLQQAIADRPLLGYGYDAFFGSAIGTSYLSTYVAEAGGWSPFHAHNSYYQIALDAGYVGVALFGVVLSAALVKAIRFCLATSRTAEIWPISILIFLMCSGFTETSFAMFNTDDWLLFIAAVLYPLVAPSPGETRAQGRTRRFDAGVRSAKEALTGPFRPIEH